MAKRRAEVNDPLKREKLELMMKSLDNGSDMEKIRERYETKMLKRTTLEDIGDQLDKMILDEEALNARFYDGTKK